MRAHFHEPILIYYSEYSKCVMIQMLDYPCLLQTRNDNANYESFWFTKLGLVCSPGLAASNFQQFSESIDTVN